MDRNEDKIRAVQRMQDHIEKHLCESITQDDLARAAGYSPGHCARVFREMTGKSPFEYIRDYRLSRAALRLRDGQERVLDVALDFVFGSHEGFTRAFSRRFGIPPRFYTRRDNQSGRLFLPTRIREDEAMRMEGGATMEQTDKNNSSHTVFVQVIERPERDFIVKRGVKAEGYYEYCEEVGCDVWEVLCAVKDALYEPIGAWMPPDMVPEGTSTYVQGVEIPVDSKSSLPEGYSRMRLPACRMMVFQGPPFKDEEFESAIGNLWEIMKEYDPTRYGFQWADSDGPRFQMEPQGYRGYMEARPVRPL